MQRERWTNAEHRSLLCGLNEFGNNMKLVANCVETKSLEQVRHHARKYFDKVRSGRTSYQNMPIGVDPVTAAAARGEYVGTRKPPTNDQMRLQMFQEHARVHGNCSNVVSTHPVLGSKLVVLRKSYRKGRLSPEMAEKL